MKICIWANIFQVTNDKLYGGGERQIYLFAKKAVEIGCSVVIFDDGCLCETTFEGILFKPSSFANGLHLFKIFGFIRELSSERADIYYCRIRSFKPVILYLASILGKGKLLVALASDLDVSPFSDRWKYFYKHRGWKYLIRDGILTELFFPFVVKKANLVLVQNDYQLSQTNNSNKVYFGNLIDEDLWNSCEFNLENSAFVFIGSLDVRKGFESLARIVVARPNIEFTIIGKVRDSATRILLDSLLLLKNVRFLGQLPHQEVLVELSKAKALISTSPREGFPNIFLEAWAVGTPVISLSVDPSNSIKRYNLGVNCESSFEGLLNALDNFDRKKYSRNSMREYLNNYHSASQLVKLLENI